MLIVPSRAHKLGDHVLTLCPNCRCWYGAETATGESYLQLVGQLVAKEFRAICAMAWFLTATSRADSQIAFPFTAEELRQGWIVPGAFLDCLPGPLSDSWWELERVIYELLQEAGVVVIQEAAPGPS